MGDTVENSVVVEVGPGVGLGTGGLTRRTALRRAGLAAAAGTLVWATPSVTTFDRATAAEGSPSPQRTSLAVVTDCGSATSNGTAVPVRYPDTNYTVTQDIGVAQAGVDLRLEFIYSPPDDDIASGILTTDDTGRVEITFGPYTDIPHGPVVRLRSVRVDNGQVLGIVDLVFVERC